jgi:hypothetical protein
LIFNFSTFSFDPKLYLVHILIVEFEKNDKKQLVCHILMIKKADLAVVSLIR